MCTCRDRQRNTQCTHVPKACVGGHGRVQWYHHPAHVAGGMSKGDAQLEVGRFSGSSAQHTDLEVRHDVHVNKERHPMMTEIAVADVSDS